MITDNLKTSEIGFVINIDLCLEYNKHVISEDNSNILILK